MFYTTINKTEARTMYDTIKMLLPKYNPHGNGARRLPEKYFFLAFDRFDEKSGYICQKRTPFHKGYNETTHRKESQ